MSPVAEKQLCVPPHQSSSSPCKTRCNNPLSLVSSGWPRTRDSQLCGRVPVLQVTARVTCPRVSAAVCGLTSFVLAHVRCIRTWGLMDWGSLGGPKPVEGTGLWEGSRAAHRAWPELGTRAHDSCYLHHETFFLFLWFG